MSVFNLVLSEGPEDPFRFSEPFNNVLYCRQGKPQIPDNFMWTIIPKFLDYLQVLQRELSPPHLKLRKTQPLLFVSNPLNNMVLVNFVTCEMLHQLFSLSISQLLQAFGDNIPAVLQQVAGIGFKMGVSFLKKKTMTFFSLHIWYLSLCYFQLNIGSNHF